MTLPCPCCYAGFSLIVEYRGCSEVTVCGLLSAVASLAAEHGRADFSGFRLRLQSAGSVIVARGLSVWTPATETGRKQNKGQKTPGQTDPAQESSLGGEGSQERGPGERGGGMWLQVGATGWAGLAQGAPGQSPTEQNHTTRFPPMQSYLEAP